MKAIIARGWPRIAVLLLFLVILGPILHNEMSEARDSGYLLLATLPLTRARLVAGKLALPLLTGVVYVPLAFAMFSMLESSPTSSAFARSYVLVSFAVCLVTVGLYYVGIFRLGFSAFFRWLPVVLVVLPFLAAMGFDRTLRTLARGEAGPLAPLLKAPAPFVVVGAGLVLYLAFGRLAALTKEIAR